MTAREKFKVGDHVRISALAASMKHVPPYRVIPNLSLGKRGGYSPNVPASWKAANGIVVGYGVDEKIVRVRPETHKTVRTYHMDFWELT